MAGASEIAKMYGVKAKKRLVIEPSEALLVQQIYRMKRVVVGKGPMGYKKIVCNLNASGATLRGRKFHVFNVKDLLTGSTYRGIHLYGVHNTRGRDATSRRQLAEGARAGDFPEVEWLDVQAGIACHER